MPFLDSPSSPPASFRIGLRWRRCALFTGIAAGHLILFAIIRPPTIERARSDPPVIFTLAPPHFARPSPQQDKPRDRIVTKPVPPPILSPRIAEPKLPPILPVPAPVTEQPTLESGDVDKAFDLYRLQLEAHLARHRRYPSEAQRRRQQGAAEISFVIAADGSVAAVSLLTSSRHRALDREAIDLIHRCAPFPVPPSAPAPLQISLPILFELQKGENP